MDCRGNRSNHLVPRPLESLCSTWGEVNLVVRLDFFQYGVNEVKWVNGMYQMHHVHTCEHRYTNSPGALGVPRLPGASDPTDKFSEILNHCANKTDFWFSQETFRVGNAQLPNCPIVQLSLSYLRLSSWWRSTPLGCKPSWMAFHSQSKLWIAFIWHSKPWIAFHCNPKLWIAFHRNLKLWVACH